MSSPINAPHIEKLKSTLGEKGYSTDPDILAPHLLEWRDKYQGQTPILIMPANTQEVSAAVQICAEHGVPIMPQGGNTGLVGGNTPQGEVLLSTKRMNQITQISAENNLLIAQAGVPLINVQEAARQADRKFPLSLASEGSCTVGGVLSTNAGGVHVIKYGTTKDLVTGVEAVLPNGEIYNGLNYLKKDNTGYDLSHMFLGAEGTLGIITSASLKLFAKPSSTIRAMVSAVSVDSALQLLSRAQSPALTMFEIMPRLGIEAVLGYLPSHRDPFTQPYPWYGLIDWEFYEDVDGMPQVETLLSGALEDGLIDDVVIAQNESQAAQLLALREDMSAAQKIYGGSIKHDVSVPVSKVSEFITQANVAMERLIPGVRPVSFGHLGDGNIHYNLSQPLGADKEAFLNHWETAQTIVHDIVDSLGGSISAEHGIGIMKKDDLEQRSDPVKLSLLRTVKSAMDPQNIMNPRVLI